MEVVLLCPSSRNVFFLGRAVIVLGLELVLYNNINKIFKYVNNIKIFKKLKLGDNNIKNWRQKCMDCVMGIFFLKINTKVVGAFVAHGSSWREGGHSMVQNGYFLRFQ
ncbi:MAG: hypothetical protein H7829_09870 [Magnetococcus sp. THC-1_WYH]